MTDYSHFRPATHHRDLGPDFSDPVEAADFPKTQLRYRNDKAAKDIGLDTLSDAAWIDHFGRFTPLPGAQEKPLALRYHGHQFRVYNPDLGDGRGFLFAQGYDQNGRLMDMGTKGSGTTPYSRRGDGRLTLKGAVREIMATELLEARGVNTSRTLSVIETGEDLVRGDEPSPTRSAVMVRLNHSHVRVGTFQRLATLEQTDNIRKLVDYVIEHYYPQAATAPNPVLALFEAVQNATVNTCAEWFAAGFVHGVLNSDNINITGESFDYGPWRFLPTLDPAFTAAYFDQQGLYAFGRQPGQIWWILARFGETLLSMVELEDIQTRIESFGDAFDAALHKATAKRLGVTAESLPKDFTNSFYQAMHASKIGFERSFFDLYGGASEARFTDSPQAEHYDNSVFQPLIKSLQDAEAVAAPHQADAPEDMLIDEVEALWAPIADEDNWQPLYDKVSRIRAGSL